MILSNELLQLAILCAASFLIGSIPTGLIIARSKGVDIRKVGSGNIGATNVLRAIGKEAAILTLAGDIAKGIIPVAATPYLLPLYGSSFAAQMFGHVHTINELFLAQGLVGLSAILGHNFSVFLRFKGGKGVATGIGVMLAYVPHAGLLTVTAWLVTFRWSRISSFSALTAFAMTPLFVYLIEPRLEKIALSILISLIIFIRHHENIRRLIQGKEGRIGGKR